MLYSFEVWVIFQRLKEMISVSFVLSIFSLRQQKNETKCSLDKKRVCTVHGVFNQEEDMKIRVAHFNQGGVNYLTISEISSTNQP